MKNVLQKTKWILVWIIMLGLLLPPANASARPAMAPTYTFTVNDEGWGTDTHPGDGICATAAGTCTLYAAISEANASSGNDLIVFDASVDEIWFGTSVAIRGDEGITIQGNQQVTLRWGGASDPFSQSQMIHIESDHNILQGLRMDGEGLIGSCVKITGNHNLLGVNINEATNHYLEQNTFEHSHYGVRITGDNNQLTGNTLKYNEWSGVTLSQGAGNIIGSYAGLFGYNYQYNYIYGNEKFGIAVIDSTDTLIAGNYVGTEGETDQDVGIIVRELGSLNNTIYSNVIHHHNNGNPHATSGVCGALENVDSGIEVCEASGTVIVGNTIISNTVGVYVWGGAAQTRIGSDGSGDAQDTRNLISNNDVGVRIVDATTEHTVVAGNYIGTDATGTTAWPNEDGVIIDAAINTRIGGTTTLERNLISGNLSHGIEFKNAASQSVIVNNYIGTTITGTAALPNQETGLLISGSGNRVGGTTPGEGNLISGNGKYGIQILGDANEAYSNTIGLDSAGTGALGNGKAGIYISGSDNVIGTTTGSPNQIAHNAEQGVWVESGTGNSLRGNTIVDNGELGIDLAPEGVTPNDAGDADPGSNNLQNYPDLSLVISSGGNTRILGTLNSTPVTTFDIDFYASDSCDAYGYGEGQTYVGTTSVATNDQGEASIYVTLPEVPVGQAIVATTTDPNGNTSEFSQCSLAVASPPAAGAYEVNSTADVVDDDTGDATCDTGNTVGSDPECTLRAAIQQANASPGADLIIVPAGIYPITITGNDNAAAMGDFDITDDVNIVGAGAAATVIDGGGMERVFHMDPSDAGIHVNLSGVTVQGGSSTGGGAGIHNRGALTLTQSVVRYNQESLNGGGLYNGVYGVLRLVDSTIYSNTANSGAGLYAWGLVTATNTTFSQNEAESSGGGIYVDYGQTWLYNVTLTENVADSDNDGGDGGGIVADSGVTVTVQNSILADNVDNSHNDYPNGYPDCVGAFTSGGYNLIGDSANKTGCIGFMSNSPLYDSIGGGYIGGAPPGLYVTKPANLGPLQDNGGPTPTHMPMPPELATFTVIDHANPLTPGSVITACTTTDQRGLPRPIDGNDDGEARCDKGAVEFFLPNLTINDSTITEGTIAVFTVTLYPEAPFTVTVPYVTGDETALFGSDYVTTSGVLTFAPGTTSQAVSVTTLSDVLNEADETFTLNLGDPENAALGGAVGTCTLVDDDPLPTLSLSDVSVTEGNSGITNAVFTVTLSTASGREVQAGYVISDGTATASQDYVQTADTVNFAAGTLTQVISVTILGDAHNELDETFTVTLDNPINALIGDGEGVGTILNDDPLPLVSVDAVTVTEGHSGSTEAVFTVALSEASGRAVQVDYTTTDDTTTAGVDYLSTSGTLTFTAGVTTRPITVTVLGDTADESDEQFLVNLSGAVNAAIASAQGVGTIVDDDSAPDTHYVFLPLVLRAP